MTTKSDDDTKRMLEAFDKFKAQIDAAYLIVRDLLAEGRYEEAQVLLARIGQTHAKTSLSLRNYLIKKGRLPAPRKESD